MKAMILAAGRGERMRPLTDSTPKPLLKVGGKPLIEYHIERLYKRGIQEIVINVAHLGDQILQYLGSGQGYGVKIEYSQEQQGLETGGGIVNALHLLQRDANNQPFVVVNADIWTDYPFDQLPSQLSGLAHLVLIDNPTHNSQGDFSLDENNKVILPNNDPLTFSGISVLHPNLFKFHTDPNKTAFPLTPLLHQAITTQQITGEYYDGQWMDVGTPERLDAVNQMLEK